MKFTLSQADVSGLSDDQQNAIFEAMVTAVLADGKIDKPEVARFEHELGLIPWGKDQPTLLKMVQDARERVQKLSSEAEVLSFINTIAGKITSQDLREKVLRMMGSVMFSDRELNQEEKNVLGAFATAFGIPEARILAIRDEVKGN